MKRREYGVDEYLEAIYKLSKGSKIVKTTELADYMGVKPSSVTEMLRRLAQKNYVEYYPYKGVKLTREGEVVGRRITRRHRLYEVFLWRILGRKLEDVHQEACEAEHGVSDETDILLCKFLGSPNKCPHGGVIPACDLDVTSCADCETYTEKYKYRSENIKPVAWLDEGVSGKIRFIRGDSKLLRRLYDLGLTPGTKIKILRKAPLNGPLEILVRGARLAIGSEIATNIFVSTTDQEKNR